MTDATAYETDPAKLVDEAAGWSGALWKRAINLHGPGQQERAMHTAAKWADVTPSTVWRLRYRKPSEVGASVYFKLKAAYHRRIQSVEAQVAANLQELRELPSTPARERLVAGMEEFLRASESATGSDADPDHDQSREWGGSEPSDFSD